MPSDATRVFYVAGVTTGSRGRAKSAYHAYRLFNPKRRRASSKNIILWINNCLKNKQRYHFGSYHNGKLEILSRYLCFGLRHEEKEQNVE